MFSYRNYTVKQYWREIILIFLAVSNIVVWLLISQHHSDSLKVSFLNVGQGDAIFFETPSGRQVLIDGGKNKKVVSELGRLMGLGDRSLDVVIATHPDADHIGGLPEVFARYEVALFIEPGVKSDNSLDDELYSRVATENSQTLLARRGQVVDLGDGAKLVILFPNADPARWETNDASIVAKLVYGRVSFLFTGDAPIKTENILLNLNKDILDTDVLKAGHHGSRTSTSLSFAQAVSPTFAVISAGRDNTYGHPHKEVLNVLERAGAQIKSTSESGTITFETNGETLDLKLGRF